MGDLLLGLMELGGDLIEQSAHCLLSVQHISGFLVALDVVLDLLLKVLVDSLVLEDAQKALVDLRIEDLVFIGEFQVLLSQVLPLESRLIKLAFACSH